MCRFFGLILIAFMIIVTNGDSIHSQSPELNLKCEMKWQFERTDVCKEGESCGRIMHTKEDKLWLLNTSSNFLYQFDNTMMSYDLRVVGLDDLISDFAILDNQNILFFRNGSIFKIFDVANNTISDVAGFETTNLSTCSGQITPPFRGFSYSSQSSTVLACGAKNIYLKDLTDTQEARPIIEFSKFYTGLLLPWMQIIAGADNRFYIQVLKIEDFSEALPNLDISQIRGKQLILSYSIEEDKWNSVYIDANLLNTLANQIAPEIEKSPSQLIAVDQNSNLYFSTVWSIGREFHVELTKLDPNGELIWDITDADIGSGFYHFVDLVEEDKFLVSSSDDKTIKINQCTVGNTFAKND